MLSLRVFGGQIFHVHPNQVFSHVCCIQQQCNTVLLTVLYVDSEMIGTQSGVTTVTTAANPAIGWVVHNSPDYYTPMILFIVLFAVSLLVIIAFLAVRLYRK